VKRSEFPVYSVSQVNRYIKDMMDGDGLLSGLLIRGEISNYKKYPSGHHYFSLKDEQGALRCVMFRGDASRLRFQPANGMRVVAFGRITVFPRDGQYQLYCNELFADGVGDLSIAFEQLKERLGKEGLFSQEAKQPIPQFPKKIALITSPAGAAVRDMIRILGSRWPMAQVLVVPVRVQGTEAPGEIAAAIHAVNNRADIDLIITGRGGGSIEDLWAFNEEIVARAIYISNIPVISAVGHEPDVTIADYVADLRAATPSNGAELAVPDQAEMRTLIVQLRARMVRAAQNRLSESRKNLERLRNARVLQNMRAPIEDHRMLLDHQQRRLTAAYLGRIRVSRAELARLCAGLDAMSPLKVLARGYAIARGAAGVVTSVEQAEPGEMLSVRLTDGELSCQVKKKERLEWQQRN
jgi:exodeoxyribonuclease VII large subunit